MSEEENTKKEDNASEIKIKHRHKFSEWYKTNKKLSIPGTVLVLVALIAAIPSSRYFVAGLFLKNDFSLTLTDSTSNSAISKADIGINDIKAVTDANGKATLHNVKVGHHKVKISKKYYKDKAVDVLVPIGKQKNVIEANLVATGRQVILTISNVINHKVLEGVEIKVLDTNAKTDKTGSATLVLPANATSEKANLSLNGYNSKQVQIKISSSGIEQNNLSLTPVGKIYFLSKLSGKIDVVKSNLDGTNRKTVIPGTGQEVDRETVLLASRDWKYLTLLSKRDDSVYAKLYLINTHDDSIKMMDGSDIAAITLVGWSNHNFVYSLTRTNVKAWQPKGQAIKSFNAETGQLATLDETNGTGTSYNNYISETYTDTYLVNDTVLFTKRWDYGYDPLMPQAPKIDSKYAGIYSINTDGKNFRLLQKFAYEQYGNTIFISAAPHGASNIYFRGTLYRKNGSVNNSFYQYKDGNISKPSINDSTFSNYDQDTGISYLLSPNGKETFWSEPRDGKNSLFIGDYEGENEKQIFSLSPYQTYGWYTDSYLLISKESSELFIISKESTSNVQPVKITDYHKPSRTFNNYGGGYGGF
jgi:hypothetical protein